MIKDINTNLQSDQHEQQHSPTQIHEAATHMQQGNTIHAGNISGIGIAVGSNSKVEVTVTEELAYKVKGLPNPYLGLHAFTSADRAIFAGRERIVDTLTRRLLADDGDRLLFIVGASGSGKSSVVRAGLLPKLEEQLLANNYTFRTQLIEHPGRILTHTLKEILSTTQDKSSRLFHLILIDQFEEIFTHVTPDDRQQALQLMSELAMHSNIMLRIIVTMRSDFLPQIIADSRFESAEQHKVIIRTMSNDELQEAIQRPIQVLHPEKCIEPALVERLAYEASIDAAYLPLLQVTLEDLWRGGELRHSRYTNLADAIQRRADTVYMYHDYDGLQQYRRTSDEQQMILGLLLELVSVSLDDKQRDVRWRRSRADLTQDDPQREQLIADLSTARLLRTDREIIQEDGHERTIETVDIVHEVLLSSWSILKDAINAERETLRQRERFMLALDEWLSYQQHDSYLLSGIRLAEAEALKQSANSIFLNQDAQLFINNSLAAHDLQQKRELQLVRAHAEAEELARIEAEKHAEEVQVRLNVEKRLRWRDRLLIALLSLVVIIGIGWKGYLEWLHLQARDSVRMIAIPQSNILFEQYEVTNGRYALCVNSGICSAPPGILNQYYYKPDGAEYPMTGIDGLQAATFCRWIGRRLPYLDEWESAITLRAGWTDEAYRQMIRHSNLLDSGSDQVQPVGGQGRATSDGIYDLVGNVWELTATGWTEENTQGDPWDGTAEHAPSRLVAKGAGFMDTDTAVKTFQRPRISDRWNDVGFRCITNR